MKASRRILVVDDDPVVARSFDRVLATKGYAVITAKDGEEALKKLDAEKYDIVFTDIRMPGMSGVEVAARVKARQPWLPVVIITGYGTDADEEKAAAIGVSGFLSKPLSPEMIETSASVALAMPHRPVAAESPAAATAAEEESPMGNVGLFLAAPFIGLAYLIAAPFLGFAALVWFGSKALAGMIDESKLSGRIAMAVAALFAGLLFVASLPLVGLGCLAWLGAKAMTEGW